MRLAYLVDFEDSFTRNIAAELALQGVECLLLRPQGLCGLADRLVKSQGRQVIVLGPGPGHPREHAALYPNIREIARLPGVLTVGICLGHQLFWAAHGARVVRGRPCHGQAVDLVIPEWKTLFPKSWWGVNVKVQRYNSLEVRPGPGPQCLGTAMIDGQLMASYGRGFLTYQFHPESVGTSCPHLFLRPIRDFLYNGAHGAFTQLHALAPSQAHRRNLRPAHHAGPDGIGDY